VTTEILQQREDTGHAAGGDEGWTLCGLLASIVQRRGGEPAYSDRDDGGPWQTITWEQTRQQALELAAGLIGLGLQPGERVALMLPNRVEHVLADLGVVHAGGVPVTFHPTLAAFAGLGMKIPEAYGMTETTGLVTANTPSAFRLGTVGRPVRGAEVKIADDGEILTRGPRNTPGYLHLPDQTAQLIDAGGWLHTGDIGSLDRDGFLSVVDRKKDLMITSGGENISPAAIENLLTAHPLIGQALSYGDRRPYVVALLTLNGDVVPAWARARGIEASSLAELAGEPAVLAAVDEAVADANERLARVQQVKRWRLLPAEWTAESEELTPTFKLRRRVVHAKYAGVIDALYAD